MTKKDDTWSQVLPAPTEAILESISDGVFTVDLDWRITSFNRAAEEITGITRQEAIGRLCCDVFRSSMCESECALRQTLETGKPIIGKSGYIIDAEGSRLPISVSTAVLKNNAGHVIGGAETFRDMSEVKALHRELVGRFKIGDLVSHSVLMQKIFDLLPAVSASPSTVLISGETGTGKELIAHTIHSLSPRRKKPFVAVNCAALPDTLLESELFGYKSGAFTGATKNKPGRFALANGGTLFLDEVGEISPALQVKLLRVLQDHQFEPLGATKTETADVRIIGATNKDLSEEMRKGNFREDLYYRVNVVRIEIPPLRKRLEDVPILVKHFIDRFNRLQEKSVEGISSEALSILMAHHWPGNVRELENIIERAFIMCGAEQIGIEHLPEDLIARRTVHHRPTNMQAAREILDAQSIRAALERNGYNRLAAARELGIHKSTLFRKIKKLGIALPDTDGRSHRNDGSH
ncbi:MAG: sigma 54-interacting transcriptional regulator [Desulfobacteraceae bacterium]|jgi:PAS domain S-box-containing protein